ncbi:type III secretion system inner membrane ring lipoprotein SctJ [Pseudomonas chlororaphis]|uniref:type III secretion system inner membrane ring lipoprotein SctJ n=1 Tax=Pseudomonas chlororaphis TaxID=587753 RepID=UPI0015E00330|nr:type III secretion inner membrane ring lipoprotein SctJ [Pseudomonas chlororaphis]QLL13461.1 type III secretion inner membrane ring lipoprotein SctJ [Pseudomonas chlororaphis subsp. aurantiaca]
MIRSRKHLGLALALMLLAGCKIDLYNGLSEQEANEMLALLMLRDIAAEKQTIKGGTVSIKVDKSQFSEAVEVLRQHGLPRKTTASMEDLFPSGQLVTSPVQEQAKILFLKEQQLEAMLTSMDGVVNARVSVAESVPQSRRESPVLSASVLVQYTPDRNLASRETDIRGLVQKGVPNLKAENISVVLQSTEYRYRPQLDPAQGATDENALVRYRVPLAASLGIVSLLCLGIHAWRQRPTLRRLGKS